jgi:hypothetical protein
VNARGVGRDVAFGVDQAVEGAGGRQVVMQFDRGDLDHPVAMQGIEAGGFGIEQDGAGHGLR